MTSAKGIPCRDRETLSNYKKIVSNTFENQELAELSIASEIINMMLSDGGSYGKSFIKAFNSLFILDANSSRPFIGKLLKEYATPKGFINYKNILLMMYLFKYMSEVDLPSDVFPFSIDDAATTSFYEAIQRIYLEGTSTFWVKPNLHEAFGYSDLPEEVPNFNFPFRNAIFLIPESITPQEMNRCLWFAVSCLEPGEKFVSYEDAKTTQNKRIIIVTELDDTIIYTSIIEFTEDNRLILGEYQPGALFEFEEERDCDKQFLKTLNAYAIKTILYLNEYREEMEVSPTYAIRQKGFGRSHKLNPNWIGDAYRRRYDKNHLNRQNDGVAKVKTDKWVWVRGFWRTHYYGKGRKTAKTLWFPPSKRFVYADE